METLMTIIKSKQESFFIHIKCNIYQHSMTVIDFSNAFKNVLSQIKNTQKKKRKRKEKFFHCLFKHQYFFQPIHFFRYCWGINSSVSFSREFIWHTVERKCKPFGECREASLSKVMGGIPVIEMILISPLPVF